MRIAPVGAWDDRGNDVLALISKRDRKYVTSFEELPFAGFAKMHWLELDLGEWDAQKPLRLIMDGYTDYFTATSMYAADQAGIKVIPPYVEALDAQGKWVRVVEDMGFPAGLERTMVADLTGKIPVGTRRIRIVNNLKIYWDAIRIDQTPDDAGRARGTSAAGERVAGFRGLSARDPAAARERHDLFVFASQHDGPLCACGGELHAVWRCV